MARLPQPGGDTNQWGEILNDFLLKAHTPSGDLLSGTVGTAHIRDGAVGGPQIADGAVTEQKLEEAVQDKLNAVGAGGATNLSAVTSATSVTVESSTGDNAVINAATTTVAGVFSATDKVKLNGIATAATANSADATLLARANHTGTQAIATVSGLQTALDAKQATGDYATNTALTNGLASKADGSAVVTLTGTQTVGGVKSFSSAPVVPDGAFGIAKTSGLQAALDGKISGQNGATGLWVGTQAQYDAIPSPAATTLYIITDA